MLNGLAVAAAAVYLVLFAIAVAPSARLEEHRRLGVSRDSDVFRLQPASFLRYYAAVHGNSYLYFEIGRRFAGKPLPAPTDPVAARLTRLTDQSSSPGSRLPHRDFDSVYPPLAALYFRALAAATRTFDGFFALLRLLNLAAVVAIIWLGGRVIVAITGGRARGYWPMAILLAAAVGPRYLSYYDAIPALCLTLAMHEGVARRWAAAGMAIAAGAWLKVFGAFLAPLFLIGAWRAGRWTGVGRFVAGSAVVSLAALLPWLLARDAHFLSALFEQGGRQYFEYGSLVGSTMVVLRRLGLIDFEYEAELDSLAVASPASAALMKTAFPTIVIGVLIVAAAARRFEGRTGVVWLLACSATVGVVLIAAPVYSPQYNLIWFSVLVVAVFLAPRLWPLAMAYFLVTQIQHPIVEGLPDGAMRETARAAVFTIRDSLFAWMAWTHYRAMQRDWRVATEKSVATSASPDTSSTTSAR